MKTTEWISGQTDNGLPFVRLGSGSRRLVVFPGLGDAFWDVTHDERLIRWQFEWLARISRVEVISRRRGLPTGYTTAAMADDYAAALAHDSEPADVLGISLGGLVAQQLAARYPRLVRRLVLVCAGRRVSRAGRRVPQHWLQLAQAREWWKFYLDVVRVTFLEYRSASYWLLLPLLSLGLPAPADFLVTLAACLGHDGTALLPSIRAPTLVIGGARDPFFPSFVLQRTAALIPAARLQIIPGVGHGAYDLRKDLFDEHLSRFLAAPSIADHDVGRHHHPPGGTLMLGVHGLPQPLEVG